jgi:hypothetical protein
VFGSSAAITRIERRRAEFSSSYNCDILTIQVGTDQQFQVFLKDFGFVHIAKEQVPQRRERELRVYRDLLAGANLGTAQYYGCVWDETAGRYWLLLEYVPGTEVRYAEFTYWVEAVRWLARMQGYFGAAARRAQLSTGNYLIAHDAAFFRDKAAQARQAVAVFPTLYSTRLAPILHKHEQVVELMAAQPRLLVHGHYRPQNILVNVDSTPLRICPVDWEVAALGSPLYDLAFLSDGFVGPMLDQLCGAYEQEARCCGLPLPRRAEMQYLLNCFGLHRMLTLLGKAAREQFSESGVERVLDRAEMFSSRL